MCVGTVSRCTHGEEEPCQRCNVLFVSVDRKTSSRVPGAGAGGGGPGLHLGPNPKLDRIDPGARHLRHQQLCTRVDSRGPGASLLTPQKLEVLYWGHITKGR